MTIHLYEGDLPENFGRPASIAIDTETMGLKPHRDRLCLVQISTGDGDAHLVRIARGQTTAPRLAALLSSRRTCSRVSASGDTPHASRRAVCSAG